MGILGPIGSTLGNVLVQAGPAIEGLLRGDRLGQEDEIRRGIIDRETRATEQQRQAQVETQRRLREIAEAQAAQDQADRASELEATAERVGQLGHLPEESRQTIAADDVLFRNALTREGGALFQPPQAPQVNPNTASLIQGRERDAEVEAVARAARGHLGSGLPVEQVIRILVPQSRLLENAEIMGIVQEVAAESQGGGLLQLPQGAGAGGLTDEQLDAMINQAFGLTGG